MMIFNPFSGIPASNRSHVRGWAAVWAELLGTKINQGESLVGNQFIYLDHGVNFGGNMNLFGGVTDKVIDNLMDLIIADPIKFISLDIPMPNYVEQLRKRIGQATCHPALTHILDALDERFKAAETMTMAYLGLTHVTIGDSHSTAFSAPGSSVLRTNGATLYGALKSNAIQAQLDALSAAPARVTLVYGSIDIRHHIGRQSDPEAALVKLCEDYATTARLIRDDYLCDVEVAAPVPVEYEGRKLPKTGYYKDTPFAGTQQDRASWTTMFIDLMDHHGLKVIHPPTYWYTMDPEEYAKTYMEMGGSVHVAPKYYRRYYDWNQDV